MAVRSKIGTRDVVIAVISASFGPKVAAILATIIGSVCA